MNRLYAKTRKRAQAPALRLPEGSWKATAVFVMVTAISLVGYISEVSSTSSKGFEIRTLKHDIATLKSESDRAEFQLAEGQSVHAIEAKVRGLGMVPADHVDYLVPASPVVARR